MVLMNGHAERANLAAKVVALRSEACYYIFAELIINVILHFHYY